MEPKKCDSCGNDFTGEEFPIVDENHAEQEGLKQCELCYRISIGAVPAPKKMGLGALGGGAIMIIGMGDVGKSLDKALMYEAMKQKHGEILVVDLNKVDAKDDLKKLMEHNVPEVRQQIEIINSHPVQFMPSNKKGKGKGKKNRRKMW